MFNKYSGDRHSSPRSKNMNKSHSNLINKSDRFEDLSYSGSNAKNKSMSKITKNIDYEFIKNSLHDVKMNVKDCD